jgi:hypothetical protein
VERDMNVIAKRMPENESLRDLLQKATTSLIRAELLSKADTNPDRISGEEGNLLIEMAADYNCPVDGSGNYLTTTCLRVVMNEAKTYYRQAFTAAVKAGLYSP